MAHQFKLDSLQASTKGEVKRLRKAGFIPVSIQHKGMETLHYQQEAHPLEEFLHKHGNAAMLELVAPDNRPHRAIVHDVQRDPLSHHLLQVTFQQVRQGDTIKTQVPLAFSGEPESVRHGDYIVQHLLDHLNIECDQDSLPEHISVNIANLQPGDVLRASDLPDNPHYKMLTPGDAVLVSLVSTRKGISEAEAEAEIAETAKAPSEPETASESAEE
jgi:large subunit ribosomal protein L25